MDKELFEDDLLKLLRESDSEAIICSEAYIDDVRRISSRYPELKTHICMNSKGEHPGFHVLEDLIKDGINLIENGNIDYLESNIDVNKMCEIVFTSGTTGPNKGTMLSQKNIITVVKGAMEFIDAKGVSFSVLPINHTYESSCHILGGIYSGIVICFNDSLKRVVENINLFKPNMSIMVPLFLESIYKNIWMESKNKD